MSVEGYVRIMPQEILGVPLGYVSYIASVRGTSQYSTVQYSTVQYSTTAQQHFSSEVCSALGGRLLIRGTTEYQPFVAFGLTYSIISSSIRDIPTVACSSLQ